MTTLPRLLAAIRAAVRDPRRTLACLNACHGVDLAVIEVHDHDYNLAHLHDQVDAAGATCENYANRLQVAVGERNERHAALGRLVAWVDAMGVERFPSFAGMNVQPLLDARAMLDDGAPEGIPLAGNVAKAPARNCSTCRHQDRPVCSGCGSAWSFPSWEPADVRVVAVATGENA